MAGSGGGAGAMSVGGSPPADISPRLISVGWENVPHPTSRMDMATIKAKLTALLIIVVLLTPVFYS
jgi:hypothetical protein